MKDFEKFYVCPSCKSKVKTRPVNMKCDNCPKPKREVVYRPFQRTWECIKCGATHTDLDKLTHGWGC